MAAPFRNGLRSGPGKRGMRRRWLWLPAVLVAGAAGFWLLRDLDGGSKQPPPPPPVPVRTAEAASGDVPIELEGIGRVSAVNTITVHPLVAGQVTAVAFRDGQDVAKGALLFQLDPRPLQATVDQDKAVLDRDRASLANAEADLKRYIPLVGGGVVSAQQVATQRSLVNQLQATAADQALLGRDQVQLGYASVTAPVSGVLGLRLVDIGNFVSPTDPAGGLIVLTQMQPINVLFALPQANLAEIKSRQAAAPGGLQAQAWTQDGQRQLDTGTLAALSNQVDAASGTVMLKGVFPNPGRQLWPGSAVSVRLVLDTERNGLTVPAAAVDQGPQGPFVWLVGDDGTVQPRPVKLRQQLHGQALVTEGLAAGDQVVTEGQYGLSQGAKVAVQQPASSQHADNSSQPGAPLRSNQPGRLGIQP